jgi:hypothetical protein
MSQRFSNRRTLARTNWRASGRNLRPAELWSGRPQTILGWYAVVLYLVLLNISDRIFRAFETLSDQHQAFIYPCRPVSTGAWSVFCEDSFAAYSSVVTQVCHFSRDRLVVWALAVVDGVTAQVCFYSYV